MPRKAQQRRGNNGIQPPIKSPQITMPNRDVTFDKQRQDHDKKFQRNHDQIMKQRQEQLSKTAHQFDKGKDNFSKHDQQLQHDIQVHKQNQRKQEQLKKRAANSNIIAPPNAQVGQNVEKYGTFTPSKQHSRNQAVENADKVYQVEHTKQKENDRNKRIHRLTRGSSNLIRKYDVNLSLDRLKRLASSNLLNLYTNRLVHWISGGWNKQNILQKRLGTNIFYNSTNKIYTNNSVKMPIILYSFPDYLPLGWLDMCRGQLEAVRNRYNRENDLHLEVSLNHVWKADNSNFSFNNSKRLVQDYDNLYRQYMNNATVLNDVKLKEREKKKAIGEDLYRKLATYQWSRNIAEADSDSFWATREFLELVVSNGESTQTAELLRECYDTLTTRLNILKIKYKDLYAVIQNYYDGFSPIGHGEETKNYIFKKYLPMLRSGEQLVAPALLRQGTISDPYGVPVGIDIYAESPMFIDYADNNLQPSTFIFATSGSGKTYLVQTMILGLLLFPDLYFPIIIDWKNEYVDLAKSSGMQIISSSPTDGLYFSTLELPDPTGDETIDERNKDNALRATESIFEILLGKELWNREGTQTAFDFIRQSLYNSHGVYLDDPSTWHNSKGLNFHTFYAQIDRILTTERGQAYEQISGTSNDDTHAGSIFRRIQETLAPYFEKNGAKSNFFKKAIRMEDIDTSRGIVFALDRDQDKGGSDADIRLNLAMQFIMLIINNLTNKKTNDKRLLTIFYEETNRLLTLPKVAEMMSGFASSGRSRGIRNFFITNAPGQVLYLGDTERNLNTDSKISRVDPGIIRAIISNVGSVIVGPNNKDDMYAIAQQYDLLSDNQLKLLQLLAQQVSQDNSDSSAMAHKFLIKHRGKTTLIQAISNPVLNQMGTFGTETKVGTSLGKEKTKDEMLKDLLHDNSKIDIYDTKQQVIDRVNNTSLDNDTLAQLGKNNDHNASLNTNQTSIPDQEKVAKENQGYNPYEDSRHNDRYGRDYYDRDRYGRYDRGYNDRYDRRYGHDRYSNDYRRNDYRRDGYNSYRDRR